MSTSHTSWDVRAVASSPGRRLAAAVTRFEASLLTEQRNDIAGAVHYVQNAANIKRRGIARLAAEQIPL